MASLRAPLGIFALHAPSHVVPRAARGVLACGATARSASSATRWKTRQGSDPFAREAKLKGLKSRAAFKLLEVRLTYFLCSNVVLTTVLSSFSGPLLTGGCRWTQSTDCSRRGK